MSGLLYLTTGDFRTIQGADANMLCTSIPGFSIIMFYSDMCSHCQTLLPIFKKLPTVLGGCQFGIFNVMNDKKKLIEISASSNTPIKYTPYIIFYVNGKPYVKYNSEYTLEDIRKFAINVANSLQKTQGVHQGVSASQGASQSAQQGAHPQGPPQGVQQDNTVRNYQGIPIQSNKVCYLDLDSAYNQKQAHIAEKDNYMVNR